MRARSIKPGFFQNEHLAELPAETRLLFIALWMMADREGRLEDRPKKIKMRAFPADNMDVDAMLNALAEQGLIVRYTACGIRCIEIPKFLEHQRPHHQEKASQLPPRREDDTDAREEKREEVRTKVRSGSHQGTSQSALNPDSLNPDSLNPDMNPLRDSCAAAATRKPDLLFEAVASACGWDYRGLTKSARGALNSAVKELRDIGAGPEDVKRRAAMYRQRWPDVDLTPTALAKHWQQVAAVKLTGTEAPKPRRFGE